MSEEKEVPPVERKSVSTRQIGFYFILLALFAPAFVLMWWIAPSYPSFSVWGMLWGLWYSVEQGGWYLDSSPVFIIGQSMMQTFLRPVFAYQMVRLYQGKSDKKQTLLVGLFVELQALIIDVPMILIFNQVFYSIHLPIPLLLLAAVLAMRYWPPSSNEKSWVEEEQERSKWWDSENNDGAKTRYLRGVTLNKVLETILIAEVILLIVGGFIVALIATWQHQAFYAQALPFLILITGLPFLMTRPTKEKVN
ncbi:MAG: hypothetical protein ACTSVR_08610 [Candidatus Thorarchaeota archaeon]